MRPLQARHGYPTMRRCCTPASLVNHVLLAGVRTSAPCRCNSPLLWLQAPRRAHVSAATGDLSQPPPSVVTPSPTLEDLRRGVSYEAQHGYTDVQGTCERFSAFAARALQALAGSGGASQGSGGVSQEIEHLMSGMAAYPALERGDRQAVVSDMMACINKLANSSTQACRGTNSSEIRSRGAMAYGWSRWLHGGGAQPMPLPSSPVQPAIPSASVSPPGGYPSLCNPVSALGDAGPASSSSGSDKDVQSTSSIDEVDCRAVFEEQAQLWWSQQAGGGAADAGSALKGEQGTDEWHSLRRGRLTASAFGNALGFWRGRREELWEEKLGLSPPFTGNDATQWGSDHEDRALRDYTEITGHPVSQEWMFKMLRDDPAHDWVGASPDGLIMPGQGGGLPGILEIKCPYNKGRPLDASPYPAMPYYYMPQVQGLMAIFDREWCDVYSWTVNGSAVYHVERDREYWKLMHSMLAEFWWENVVPAKHALRGGDLLAMKRYRPAPEHPETPRIVDWSRRLSRQCPMVTHPPRPREP